MSCTCGMPSIKEIPVNLLESCPDIPDLQKDENPIEHHIKVVREYKLRCEQLDGLVQSLQ